jgi:prepilin-type N-terminal cleavage/methylation domain-containing protein
MSRLDTLPRRATGRSGGFTLVELLVTITIIGMLAGLILAGLAAARETARATKTKGTIAKLDRILMARYESYRTRRAPISVRGLPPNMAAEFRLRAVQELMRREMPERWTDITKPDFNPNVPLWIEVTVDTRFGTLTRDREVERPGLSRVYLYRFQQRRDYLINNSVPVPDDFADVDEWLGQHGPAECLYLLVSMGSPEDRKEFKDNEIGDADGDGLLEFHDGWGRPIYFLRWAPGFIPPDCDSDIQTGNATDDPDPFDPRGIDGGYQLHPLVYSGGPDEEYGIELDRSFSYYYPYTDPAGIQRLCARDPYYNLDIGGPALDGTANARHDNIHNHRIEAD